MLESKKIACRPGIFEDCTGIKYERLNTAPYQFHNVFVPEFYDLTSLSCIPRQYWAMSETEVSKIKPESFLFKNFLNCAYALLHEDEYFAARIWIRIWKRKTGNQYLNGHWHSHNFSNHHGILRDSDRMLMVSTSNPTPIIKTRNLLERTELEERDHFYPEIWQKIKNGTIPATQIISAKPGQIMEIRENEAHVSPIESEIINNNLFRILIALAIPHSRQQIRLHF